MVLRRDRASWSCRHVEALVSLPRRTSPPWGLLSGRIEVLEAPMTGLLSGTLAGGPPGSFFLSRVFFLECHFHLHSI